MESVFINYLKKASLLGLAGLLIFTFLVLSKEIIGKDLLPTLSEENSFELLKYILRGGFFIIILVVVLSFIKSMIPNKIEEAKEKKRVVKPKKSKWWLYPLMFILGVFVSLIVIAFVKKPEDASLKPQSSIVSQIDDDLWDIRNTARIKTKIGNNEITYSNKTNNTYFRNVDLSNIEGVRGTSISTTFYGVSADKGYYGALFSDENSTYTIYVNDNNEIYLGRIVNDEQIKLVDWTLNYNLSSVNTFDFLVNNGTLVISVNGVKFVPIEEFSSIEEFAIAINNSDITIKEFKIE